MGRRAEALAGRIEEGAALLAAFAEGLSEADWRAPMRSGKDTRSVGVIVHHVASMYPVEIYVAKAVASGKAVTDVTWEAVGDMSAGHARDHSAFLCQRCHATRAYRCADEFQRRLFGQPPMLQ